MKASEFIREEDREKLEEDLSTALVSRECQARPNMYSEPGPKSTSKYSHGRHSDGESPLKIKKNYYFKKK